MQWLLLGIKDPALQRKIVRFADSELRLQGVGIKSSPKLIKLKKQQLLHTNFLKAC